MRTADGRADAASDWATLTERIVGFPVPVDGLAFWAQGAPRAGCARTRRKSDGAGRVGVLRQDGCEIVYAYADDAARLPSRLRLALPRSRAAHRHRSLARRVSRWRRRVGDNADAQLTVPAPAKLNLFLHVTGRRDDGYHLLETLFVALDAGDTITLTLRDDGAIARTTELAGVRAAGRSRGSRGDRAQAGDRCARSASTSPSPSAFRMGGGMGGGSSDAAIGAARAQPAVGRRACRARSSCGSVSRWAPTFRSFSAASPRSRAASASA